LLFLIIRFVMGIFTAPIYPASVRMVGHWMPPSGRATASGLIMGAALVGNASNFLILGWIIDVLDWSTALVVAGLATALLGLVWMFVARDYPDEHTGVNNAERELIAGGDSQKQPSAPSPGERRLASSAWRALLGNRSLVLLTVSYAAVGYFEYLFFFWMHHYFDQVLEIGAQRSRFYTCIALLSMAAGMALGGWLSDRLQRSFGRRWARLSVAAGGMIAGAGLLLFGLAATEPARIVTWFSLALAAVGASEGPFWTTALELGGPRGGASCGIFNTGGNLGGLLAPTLTPLIGFVLPDTLTEVLRWKVAISVGSLFCLIGAVLWWKIDPAERSLNGPAPSDP
jgi:sugar phosphate permease